MKQIYLCPECGSELKLESQPQYHNEYLLYFDCLNCSFRTETEISYKNREQTINNIIKMYNIKTKEDVNERYKKTKAKKEIFNQILKNLLEMSDEEFQEKLKSRENGDISKALRELWEYSYGYNEDTPVIKLLCTPGKEYKLYTEETYTTSIVCERCEGKKKIEVLHKKDKLEVSCPDCYGKGFVIKNCTEHKVVTAILEEVKIDSKKVKYIFYIPDETYSELILTEEELEKALVAATVGE